MSSGIPPVPSVAVLTAEQIQKLVRDAVESALAAQREDVSPALLDRTGLAQALGVSVSTVNRLRQQGLPCLMLGDAPRFVLSTCLQWLEQHDGA